MSALWFITVIATALVESPVELFRLSAGDRDPQAMHLSHLMNPAQTCCLPQLLVPIFGDCLRKVPCLEQPHVHARVSLRARTRIHTHTSTHTHTHTHTYTHTHTHTLTGQLHEGDAVHCAKTRACRPLLGFLATLF